jgi:hypothetical protein
MGGMMSRQSVSWLAAAAVIVLAGCVGPNPTVSPVVTPTPFESPLKAAERGFRR